MTDAADPAALFRTMLGQWEKMANDYGAEFLKRPEAAQAMHGATNATLQAQQAMQEVMAKALAAAHMPSKADIEAISARLGAVEASLARIEAKLGSGEAATPAARPKRTRTPPPKG
ncbi:MAG: hypothetical protein H0X36_10040 [Sphingomonadaceae bacterium]|nr:hypothetical protein [Sphingomonadaceae bacterium]